MISYTEFSLYNKLMVWKYWSCLMVTQQNTMSKPLSFSGFFHPNEDKKESAGLYWARWLEWVQLKWICNFWVKNLILGGCKYQVLKTILQVLTTLSPMKRRIEVVKRSSPPPPPPLFSLFLCRKSTGMRWTLFLLHSEVARRYEFVVVCVDSHECNLPRALTDET